MCFQSCFEVCRVYLDTDVTWSGRENACSLNFVCSHGRVTFWQALWRSWGMVGCSKSSWNCASLYYIYRHKTTDSKDSASADNLLQHGTKCNLHKTAHARKLTLKTFHSTLDKDWIAPSLSSVLPCHWIPVPVSLSHTDQPVRWDPWESNFSLHKLWHCKHMEKDLWWNITQSTFENTH